MRFRVCMIIMILLGVLLGGIGAGAAFAEFSDLEYEGTVWLGMENTAEKELIYEMEEKDLEKLYCYAGMSMQNEIEVIEDRKIPMDEVHFQITYNSEYGEPMLESYDSYDDSKTREIHIWLHGGNMDELETIMDLKDRILEDLKDRKISSYRMAAVIDMEIRIHPSNAEKLIVIR